VVSIQACLDVALRLAANEIAHRGRLVRVDRARPMVEGHDGRLVQVFSNLLLNAAQALPERSAGGEVQILVDEADGRAVVEITDTGAGISADVMVRIFEPFFTTKPVGVGTGLGLPIAHGIVRQLGGDITVRSKVGEGATFRVELPLASAAAVARAGAVTEPVPTVEPPRRLRVLLVDDDPMVLRLFGELVGEEHDVVLAVTGREALTRIAEERPDVIVTDLMMPEMTGMELYAAVQERDPDLATRVLFVTGGAFTPSAQAFVAAMHERVMLKPVKPAALLAAVADLAP
jgi:CheY-like chemotaxis protein